MADVAGDSTISVPELLTQEEVVALLRLDRLGLQEPKESLRHLRRTGQIGYVKVAGKVLIPREEIVAYLERQRVRPHE
jgi:maltooligosyltrehalose synthase